MWTEAQSQRLIESIHHGISIGSIAVSDSNRTIHVVVDGKRVERFPDTCDLLVDGQQRLRAIRRYLDNDLAVFVGTPHEHRFEDLSMRQRRRFTGTSLGYIVLESAPMDELRRIYDLMNFGGTAHTEDQRASTQATG